MLPRQVIESLMSARGMDAVYAPTPPNDIKRPLIWTYLSRSYQWVKILSVGMKIIATPSPTNTRAAIAVSTVCVKARAMDPAAPIVKKKTMDLRGPHESESRPAGICISA